ncbi:DUF3558 domain-containing protein [Amycolatopsis sp. NPDC051071]|uniref:DUF3558 domain-containing protein n=1 Tax=Amycolatopsis sp. NPDC051071 TaxID=3154637 RepID=UPI003425BDB7
MRRTILVLGAAALALSACSTPTTNGTPTPTSGGTSPSPSNPASPAPGVPKVGNPIDLTRVKQSPCSALTSTQAKDLLGQSVESKGREGQFGPACLWSIPSAIRPHVDVLFSNLPDSGTARFYAAKGTDYKLLEPIEPIDGYPLTAYGTEDERTSKGRCAVALGTSNTETISIALEQSEANIGKKDPCDAAREAAIRVLTTIRGGN